MPQGSNRADPSKVVAEGRKTGGVRRLIPPSTARPHNVLAQKKRDVKNPGRRRRKSR